MNNKEYYKLIQTCISAFTTTPPSILLINNWYEKDYVPSHNDLQSWIINTLKPEFEWQTAIGIIEASQNMIAEARKNGNIKL